IHDARGSGESPHYVSPKSVRGVARKARLKIERTARIDPSAHAAEVREPTIRTGSDRDLGAPRPTDRPLLGDVEHPSRAPLQGPVDALPRLVERTLDGVLRHDPLAVGERHRDTTFEDREGSAEWLRGRSKADPLRLRRLRVQRRGRDDEESRRHEVA